MAVDDLIEAAMEVLIGDMTEGCIDEAVWITGDEACEKAAIEAVIRIAEAAEAERIRQACSLLFLIMSLFVHPYNASFINPQFQLSLYQLLYHYYVLYFIPTTHSLPTTLSNY